MKTKKHRTIFEIDRDAFRILAEHLGIEDTLRFFHAHGWGKGDYARERKRLFNDMTIEDRMRRARGVEEKTVSALRARGVEIVGDKKSRKPPKRTVKSITATAKG